MKRSSLAIILLMVSPTLARAQAPTETPSPNVETRPRTISAPIQGQSPTPLPRRDPLSSSETEPARQPNVVVGNKPEPGPPLAGPTATERRPEPASTAPRFL